MNITKKAVISARTVDKTGLRYRLRRDISVNKTLYLLVLPVVAFYIIFNYIPMYGAVIAFKDFTPGKGILGSPWVGLKHFHDFFTDAYFLRSFKNTIIISLSSIVFGFPAPIILALLINEIRRKSFMKTVQTVTYLPHFISLVVICGMIKTFTAADGLIGSLFARFTDGLDMLNVSSYFVPIYVISDIWQGVGWGSIVYLATLTGIDQELYEACRIDGAGRWKQTLHVTLPGIMPTIVIMLILRMGSLLGVGFEKIILLYNANTYETADVISSYVYRRGLQEQAWSYSSAVGLVNSVINFILIIATNWFSRKVNDVSLW